ncbi:cell division protein FtsQ [Lutibacter sp. HS1-25]|uniref:cell division protein FtsQ/DivIB n=1 Tax=Lutibacter sp. HS1-25 TaxID=2485000 RepID=UPI001011AE89|nr:cell division protein FtsQ [Lutibacter sp. HS1-25]RXP60303.1 cell division protein FtsQ [Lutibacter sp. HS1-25]
MKVNWNIIKGIVLLGSVGFLVGFSYEKNKAVKISEIDVEFEDGSNLFMDYQMVNKLLIQNGKTVKNQPKSVIDLHNLEANVISHPMVESASVFLTVDGLLKTKIKQRTPIARVITQNKSYYIDSQAKTMPLSENHSARVLLISGDIKETDNEQIHLLVSKIMGDGFLKKQIIAVEKINKNEFVLIMRVGDQKVEIGKIENLDSKFKNLNSFLNKTMSDQTIDNYASINLEYNNQVVCTKK